MSKQRKRLGRVPRSAPTDFVSELTIFHEEQAIAQRCFFGYLAIRDKAAKDNELLGVINLNPWFWTTVYYSLLLATFMALGRIFDQDSAHNVDKLMSTVKAELFSGAALRARLLKKGLSADEVTSHGKHAHELTPTEVRKLRKEVKKWRARYDQHFGDIRRKVFAHREFDGVNEINALFAKAKVAAHARRGAAPRDCSRVPRHRRPCRTIAALHSENAAGVRVHGSARRASSIANRCLLKYVQIGGDGPSRSPLDSS
jgi:hypothetical protein